MLQCAPAKSDYSVLSFTLPVSSDPFPSVLAPAVKGAGGKPFPSALAERITFPGCVWPEFTMGEYMSAPAWTWHGTYASDS